MFRDCFRNLTQVMRTIRLKKALFLVVTYGGNISDSLATFLE